MAKRMKPIHPKILMMARTNSTGCYQHMYVESGAVELTFAIASDTEDLDNNKCDKENSNPDTDVEIRAPEADSETGSGQLKRQHGQPRDSIVPADGETPVSV